MLNRRSKWWKNKVRVVAIAGDIGTKVCQQAVQQAVDEFGKLDILVNNAAEQHPQEKISRTSAPNWNAPSHQYFLDVFLTKAALKHLKEGSAIINTSVTAYKGSPQL